MVDYFDPSRIGSSIFGQVISRLEPLTLCLDRATVPVKPSGYMESGKIFEDWIEQEYSGRPFFDDKYFQSDLAKIPEYKGEKTDIQQILEILDIGEFEKLQLAIDDAYIRKNDGSLHGSYKSRHRCLDQIRAHEYRRPIPKPFWKKLQIMRERFAAYPFTLGSSLANLGAWMKSENIKIEFQTEFFWTHECGAECRAKFDMIWSWKVGDFIYAMPFDFKVTANWPSFMENWSRKYIWQSKHYTEGFKRLCVERGWKPFMLETPDNPRVEAPWMPFIIQESEAPQVTHCRALSAGQLDYLTESYDSAVRQIWEWIQVKRPVSGHMKQEIVDRFGRPE
jgi:hypothetical protein